MRETIQSFWIGRPLGPFERLTVASFLAQGHPFHLYAYDELEGLPEGAELRDAAEILPRRDVFRYGAGAGKGSFAAFANRFRWKLLVEQGNWWVDLDCVALRPFEFDRDYVYGWEDDGVVATGVLRAPAHSELAIACYETVTAMGKDYRWGEAGPRMLSRILKELGLEHHAEPRRTFYPVRWQDWRTLFEGGTCLQGGDGHAIHLWNEMQRRHGRPRAAPEPPSSPRPSG